MSKIKDILSIQLENDIKNVIDLNSQKEEDIKDELNGFVLTESLSKHLSDFLDVFCSDMKDSGVWLSGFYGSGKSYFAKMLGFLISNPMIQGTPMRDRFMTKLIGLKNKELLENQIHSLNKIVYQTVLFDCAKVDSSHGISYMAMSHFLLSLGFMSNWIGMMEYNLMLENKYEDFLSTVKKQNDGKEWFDIRKKMSAVPALKKAILTLMNENEYDETRGLINDRINTYDAIKLKEDLSLYLEINPQKKIVFFIDEVSEALSQKKINLLDLEGLAEALSSFGNKVWTIGIAQQSFNDVLNASGLNLHQLNKLEARFKTRIPIAAEEIDVIIRKRLLNKTEKGEQQLKAYYEDNSGMIQDVTNIVGVSLQVTKDALTYSDYYPFYEHQFKLLQYFLFGSRDTVTSQIGTRGMLVSVFDVLKKEAIAESDVYIHVNATQLCKQAEENIPESLRIRYEQADNHISKANLGLVNGKELLQTIHFLEKAEAHTSSDNITKSYIKTPEKYYETLAEVKKALGILEDSNVLIKVNNQYRITSQIEQQIIDDMNGFDPEPYRAISEVTKILKQEKIIKTSQSLMLDGQNIPFCVESSIGENFANQSEKFLKICFYDMFYEGTESKFVTTIKDETQSQKGKISIIPSNKFATKIMDGAKDLLRIDYINSKTYHTAEEKKVQNNIISNKEEKLSVLIDMIRKAYVEGTIVYLYNTYQLNDTNYSNEIGSIQRKMYANIFTKSLTSSLSDALAPKVLSSSGNQLSKLFCASDDFRFFDTTGKFIGDNLTVVSEILALCKSFCTGSELENKLSAPPTGYKFGTIITTVAALFRGNKVIAKYSGKDFHSVTEAIDAKIFENTRNFEKASFKAVLSSISYTDRQEIVDILKDDCQYKKITGDNAPSYNLNDFEIVDCIRTLAKRMMDKVNDAIMGDDEKEKLFKRSVAARNVFSRYTATVTDINYIATATMFLQEADDFISAVEIVQKDLLFIANEFKTIEIERNFIQNVIDEYNITSSDATLVLEKQQMFDKAREINMVANEKRLKELTQEVKDIYVKILNDKVLVLNEELSILFSKLENIKNKLVAFPEEWNMKLIDKIATSEKQWKLLNGINIQLNSWNIKCSNSGFSLRDLAYKIQQLRNNFSEIDIWESEIISQEPPTVKPYPTTNNTNNTILEPTHRNMRSKLPKGTCSVIQYKEWLKEQLILSNKFNETDILNFDN